MKNILLTIILFNTFLISQKNDSLVFPNEKHLINIKMLTDEGENAEAYLSFNEKKLSYQWTNDLHKCDQIYTMNIDGTDKKIVSNGKGSTTCAYYLPGDSLIIYASTHLTFDKCPPPPDRSKGYVWKLYPEYDIFVSNEDGTNSKRLTDAYGYDAEATVSPIGDKIIFTSTRDGDPELYTMNINGLNQKRLTFEKGYDGGAFYSLDGKKIVFRASRPKTDKDLEDYNELVKEGLVRPSILEIFTMDEDGKNMKQITNLGRASFAPFFHPDGKRIIFCSNYGSKNYRDFNLFMINIDGTGLEQITFYDSFDGFPMFTRNGKKLIFASNRFGKKQGNTNIFIADWVD